MPITLDKKLPAVDILRSENIFVMDDIRATHQDIRPMNVLILNLMPTKVATETQLLRLLANTPLQINVDFLYMTSHESKTTAAEHMEIFYKSFEDIKENYYDGLIITGAPVEKLAFEEVDYWEELTKVFDWSKRHVFSTLHLCWGAQAGLYYRYGIEKVALCDKLSGIYEQTVLNPQNRLMRGFDDAFLAPHSRYTDVPLKEVLDKSNLQVLAQGSEVGLSILASPDLREVYSFGHLEYDRDTLAKEYFRDRDAGLDPHIPENYFKDDDVNQTPCLCWSSSAALFFSNWVNYAVYQETPFDWRKIEDDASAFGYL